MRFQPLEISDVRKYAERYVALQTRYRKGLVQFAG